MHFAPGGHYHYIIMWVVITLLLFIGLLMCVCVPMCLLWALVIPMYLVCVLSFCGAFGLFVNLAVCPRKIRVQVRDGSVSFYWERKPFLLNSPKQKNTFLVTTWSFLGRQHTFSACKYNYCFSNIYISLFIRQVPQSTVSFQKMKKVHFLCLWKHIK